MFSGGFALVFNAGTHRALVTVWACLSLLIGLGVDGVDDQAGTEADEVPFTSRVRPIQSLDAVPQQRSHSKDKEHQCYFF